ncbi:MAG: HAD family hydrolase [Chloroflexota bacterium]
MKLVIFDLDQTLVDVVPVHDRAATAVFKHFFGVDGHITEVEFAGRSLIENFLAVAQLKSIPEQSVLEKMPAMLDYYDKAFIESFPADCSKCVLPGARELLDALAGTGNILALYTGDSEAVASIMLERTALDHYFRIRFFGTEVKRRPDMITLARNKAAKLAGRPFSGEDIVVVGDSIKDIEAGKEHKARTVAIATGSYPEMELSRYGPDFVFEDMEDWRKVMAAILDQ